MEGNGKAEFEKLILTNKLALGMREPGGRNYLLALELAGKNTHMANAYEAMLCVATINNEPQITRNKLQLDALADRLGRNGLDEVNEWFQRKQMPELFEAQELLAAEIATMPTDEALQRIAVKAMEIKAERLKNLQGTQ